MPLELTPDQRAVATKNGNDAIFALRTFTQQLAEGTLEPEFASTLLSLIEMQLADVSRATGVPTESAERVKERSRDLRAANIRISELERQLAAACSADTMGPACELLREKLGYWWRCEGLGHVSEFDIRGKTARVQLSGTLFGDFALVHSETPVSDKERWPLWLAALRERGFVLSDGDGERRDVHLIDCDQTRDALSALIRSRFPSAYISSISSNGGWRDEGLSVRSIEVCVRELADIAALPAPPKY